MKLPIRYTTLSNTLHEVITPIHPTFSSRRPLLCVSCLRSRRRGTPQRRHEAFSVRKGGSVESVRRFSSKRLQHVRHLATVSNGTNLFLSIHSPRPIAKVLILRPVNPESRGPLDEYDDRVRSHQLRDDEHQRGVACLYRPAISQALTTLDGPRHRTKLTGPSRHVNRLPGT